MKRTILLFSFLFAALAAFSQDVSIKKGLVYVDGVKCLKIDGSDPNNVTIMDMDENELVFLKYIHDSKYADLYCKVIFLEQELSLTAKSYMLTKKILLKKLVKDGTIDNCALNPAKVKKFVLKYDEDIEKETIKITIEH